MRDAEMKGNKLLRFEEQTLMTANTVLATWPQSSF